MVATTPTGDPPRVGAHNCVIEPALKGEVTGEAVGKYGRMFPGLPAPLVDEDALLALGRSGAALDDAAGPDETEVLLDNRRIPAGWTFFGQFIAHDITADRSLLQHHANVDELRNFRTPRLDLESVYAAGPGGSPYQYDVTDGDTFLLGVNDAGQPDDLPRNSQGVALIGDKRNDVHLFVSQLHVAFLKFHNRVVAHLRAGGTAPDVAFDEAQRLVRWHYQWIAVHEFLPLTVGQDMVDDILARGRRYYRYAGSPYIPVEFSDAAYRYGHSQIRDIYQLNDRAHGNVFPDCVGGCPVLSGRVLDWRLFFAVDPARPPQQTRRLDARLVHPLIALPPSVVGATPIPEYGSLAVRDLVRGRALDLPSGEAVARLMGVAPLAPAELGLRGPEWRGGTPLWYYVLKEAEVRAGGECLGPVGGRIVAEVLLGLIDGDPRSYRSVAPTWTPMLPSAQPGHFTMADLLRFARVV